MSIIHEALKKAGQETDAVGMRKNLQIELQRKKEGVNWGPVFVILVLVMITTPIVAPMFSMPFRHESLAVPALSSAPASQNVPATPPVSSDVDNSMLRSGQFGIEEVSRAQMLPPDLSLTGIMYSPSDASYCIINNKIVKIGDTVSGAKLVQVKTDQAVLEFEGQEISLYSTEA